ncbi:hypothetical protein [Herpetosiphon geysericola]|uniref:Uncharacterized protein n=1 Tax=Herpetosiphon geysericola TaxID=70996 RepID=A0A0P6Y1Y7_9CHLR|nr:hypothetical protein [Herpetosiphon geysericola]KPL83005.1 hypothetical protein SE18_19365 [Herpetosiphon geysericola]
MRRRLWVLGVLLVVSGFIVVAGRDTARLFGLWWGPCYTIPELERFPETRFRLPDATVKESRTIEDVYSQRYPWYDSLDWVIESPQDSSTIIHAYTAYLAAQGWQMAVNNPPLQISWRKDRLRMELSMLSPDQVRPQLRPAEGSAATLYLVQFMESDTGSCSVVPPAPVE